jgi:hypothetical protein
LKRKKMNSRQSWELECCSSSSRLF